MPRRPTPAAESPAEPAPRKPRARKAAARVKKAPAAADGGSLADEVKALRELVADLPSRADLAALAGAIRDLAARPASEGEKPTLRSLQGVTSSLGESVAAIREALAEVPRASEFQPLADHLYEFARVAPQFLEQAEAIPRVAGSIEASVKALAETAETLTFAHESFAESLLKLPRAEDYEPLARPLAEFARVAPMLAESLSAVQREAAPLAESVRGLNAVAESLQRTRQALAAPGGSDPGLQRRVEEAVGCMEWAETTLTDALRALPRDPEYARFASQLREIASVSPSLLSWMQQLHGVTAPLAESVEALRQAAEGLRAGRERLLGRTAFTSSEEAAEALLRTLRELRQHLETETVGIDEADRGLWERVRALAGEARELERLLP